MKPSDMLNRASEIMIERGHAKGGLKDAAGHLCLLGAVGHAFIEGERVPIEVYTAARRHLRSIVGVSAGTWNDRPETTEAMALDALHQAALLAKEAGE